MTFEQWQSDVAIQIRGDALWKMEAYRLGLFLSDLAWIDSGKLLRERRTLGVADQLYRAVGNISSNIAEGYSRGTGRDRARLYEYALGSVREARDWYYKSRHVLADRVTEHRLDLSTQLVRLLIRMVSNERRSNRRLMKEPSK
jgi:four helix bundle protein